jgi:transcription antitermination factor NusG
MAELLSERNLLVLHELGGPESMENNIDGGPNWYAAYTRFRYEKRVAEILEYWRVEHYLPLYEAVHRWKDRKARLQLPLFPSYVFVRLDLRDRMNVLTVPGVIRLVGHPHPAPLSGREVEAIRDYLSHSLPVEPYAYLTSGRLVRIKAGPLAGLEGIILRRKSACRVVINLDPIRRAMVVELPASDLEPIRAPSACRRAA